MGSGMSLPMGEDRSTPMITEVWSIFSTSLICEYIFLHITSDSLEYYHLFTLYCFWFHLGITENLPGQSHMELGQIIACGHNAALEVALLALPPARILDLLALATLSPMASTTLHVTTTPSVTIPSGTVPPPPQVPIVEVTSMAEASTRKKRALTPSTLIQPKAIPSKYQKIVPMPVYSSPSSNYHPLWFLSLQFWQTPFLSGLTALDAANIISAGYVHFSIPIMIVCWCTFDNI